MNCKFKIQFIIGSTEKYLQCDWLRKLQHWFFGYYDSNAVIYFEDKEKSKYISVSVDKIEKLKF